MIDPRPAVAKARPVVVDFLLGLVGKHGLATGPEGQLNAADLGKITVAVVLPFLATHGTYLASFGPKGATLSATLAAVAAGTLRALDLYSSGPNRQLK